MTSEENASSPRPEDRGRLMTVDEAAAYLQLNPETIRRYLRAGVLRGERLPGAKGRGGPWRVRRCELDRIVQPRR
jgi:excisionase family DNA binding protein